MHDSRELHAQAAAAYRTWAEWTETDRVWDELKTYEMVAWRHVVRTVRGDEVDGPMRFSTEPLTFQQLLDMAAANGAGPGHDTEADERGEDR